MIYVDNIAKSFGRTIAVKNISFDIQRAEIFAILGVNGAGKTTTIRLLTTLLAPESGTISLDGLDVQTQRDEVRKIIGIVFQEPSLDLELSAWENLEFQAALYGLPRRQWRNRIDELLEEFGLKERRQDRAKVFSPGMRRRLEIARGLIHTPRVLVLDEPTVGLDPQTRHQVWGHLRRLSSENGVTVVVTTHYMEEAERVADRLIIMDRGEIIAKGTPLAIREQAHCATLDEAFVALTASP